MAWDIGNGEQVRVSIDPFVRDNDNYKLPKGIISHLEVLNLSTLNKIIRPSWAILKGGYWFMSKDLGFIGIWAYLWDSYIHTLNVAGIRFISEEDKLA